jgi:hypothetical protein
MSAIASKSPAHPRHALEGNAVWRRAATVALIVLIAGWSLLVVRWRLSGGTPLPAKAMKVLLFAVPISLAAALVLRRSRRTRELGAAAAWTVVLAGALLLVPHVIGHLTLAIGIPAALLTAVFVARRPDIAVTVLVLVSGCYGSLFVYLHFHYLKLTDLLLAGLWLAAIGGLVVRRRVGPRWVWAGVLAAAAYLFATLVQVLLSSDQAGALSAFEVAPVWMMTFLVVGYSGWSADVHRKIVNGILIVALAVGAYATLRYIIGPSSQEFFDAAKSPYNFVNGKMKLLGSFPNGADLGAWAAMMLPFCLVCALALRGRIRLVAAIAVPLLAVALLGSQLRAGAVADLLAVAVTLILLQVARAYPSGVRIGRAALAVIFAVVIGAGAFTIVSSRQSDTGSRYSSLLTVNSNDPSFSEHRYKWETALRDLPGHPFGYGVGTAVGDNGQRPLVGGKQRVPVNEFTVDNGYLKIALEQGLIITGMFAASLLLILAGLARRAATTVDPQKATIAIGAAGTLTALIVLEGGGAFVESMPIIATWVVVGLGIAQFQGRGAGGAVASRPRS